MDIIGQEDRSVRRRPIARGQKVDIDIDLAQDNGIYTNGDCIQGLASITASGDTPFDEISIDFNGISHTFVSRVAMVTGKMTLAHGNKPFLSVPLPGVESRYPRDRILRARQRYSFPFRFVVPDKLLESTCQHAMRDDAVFEAHSQLPPSMGDFDSTVRKGVDEMVPSCAKVKYAVCVAVAVRPANGNRRDLSVVAFESRPVRIQPQAPAFSNRIGMPRAIEVRKTIKKGPFSGSVDRLVIGVDQPRPLLLRSTTEQADPPSADLTLHARFYPDHEDTPPPELDIPAVKLNVCTFLSCTPRRDLATTEGLAAQGLTQELFEKTLDLPATTKPNVMWTELMSSHSRLTESSGGQPPSSSPSSTNGLCYEADLRIPVRLPSTKHFVTTFHSCLISRTYELDVRLKASSHGWSTGMKVKVPVDIHMQRGPDSEQPPSYRSLALRSPEGVDLLPSEGQDPPEYSFVQ